MADKGVTFSESAAARIANAVRTVEGGIGGGEGGGTGRRVKTPLGDTSFYAVLKEEGTGDNAGKYKWEAVYRKEASFAAYDPKRDSDGEYTAYGFNKEKGIPSGTYVLLTFAGYVDDAPTYVFQAAQAKLFVVFLTKDGGNAGGNNQSCTFTYTAKKIGAAQADPPLMTAASPDIGRINKCKYSEGTVGLAYFDANNSPKLYQANEVLQGDEITYTPTGQIQWRQTSTALEYRYMPMASQTFGVLYRVSGPAPQNPEDTPWSKFMGITEECPDQEGPP